tara:strand:- start:444 stop:599 length:156 start_codon:yes stop_codon:yes gene_type:complete
VGVIPFQSACNRGAYTWSHEPGSLTIIIKIIVTPLRRSSDNNLWELEFVIG